MKAAKLGGVALAILLTAMVCRARADLIIDLEATAVVGSDGLDLNGSDGVWDANNNETGPVYSLSSDGKTVGFNASNVIPATGAWVQMEVYADVLDSAGSIAYWDNTYGAAKTTIAVGGHNYYFLPPGTYDPGLSMVGTYTTGTGTHTTLHSTTLNATSAPTVFTGVYPYAPLGVATATLRLYNSATSTGLAGTITAVPNSSFSAASTTGANWPAAQAGGIDLGLPVTQGSVTINGVTGPVNSQDFFSESYNQAGNYNPASPGFSYLTASGTIQIGSSTYMQVPLGAVYFEVTSGVGGKQAIIAATPEGNLNNNATLQWMESLTTTTGTACYGAGNGLNIGTYSSNAPVTVSVGGAAPPGALGITAGPTMYSDMLFGGQATVSVTLSNNSSNNLNEWSLSPLQSPTLGGGTVVTTANGINLAGGSTTPATGLYTAPLGGPTASAITQSSIVSDTVGLVANTTDNNVTPSPSAASTPVNVGGATAAQGVNSSPTFGAPLSGDVPNGAAYAGLASIVKTGGANPANALGSVAMILAGSNNSGGTETVTMAWRTRAPNETGGQGTVTEPPMSMTNKAGFLISDVVQVGISGYAGEDYVIEMTYDAALLGGTGPAAGDLADGWLYLATLSGEGFWENAVAPTGVNGGLGHYQGNEAYPGGLLPLGDWGVDIAHSVAWAVVNYVGDFAVVPEPGTFALLAAGALALLPFIRRRLKKS
jgi:hypothetical protein